METSMGEIIINGIVEAVKLMDYSVYICAPDFVQELDTDGRWVGERPRTEHIQAVSFREAILMADRRWGSDNIHSVFPEGDDTFEIVAPGDDGDYRAWFKERRIEYCCQVPD